ncbi:hypothetical protein CAEBREN_25695 [Caenorhabditis brenneri]|uniref:Uncharacterized protein n=1 Tax=Caenorhabditis brenneri TaxID=135651 RepID=G0MI12_CAEBE|nr:hypothetical protein CAEBREN_25695 [Caenorhabditis brenneri]
MVFVTRRTWIFIFLFLVFSLSSCEFTTPLTYIHVAGHVAILTGIFCVMAYPPEGVLDELGVTLFDFFSVIYVRQRYNFIEYSSKRIIFFKTFLAMWPSAISFYFVHGYLRWKSVHGSRFPELLDFPLIWYGAFVVSVIGAIAYYMRIKDYEQWPIYQYFVENPEVANDVELVLGNAEAFRVSCSQRTLVVVTAEYFIYSSNWRYVAVKNADVRFVADHARPPAVLIMDDGEERLRSIYIRGNFTPNYIPSLPLALRLDHFRAINETLPVPIFIPAGLKIPLTVMDEMLQDFALRITKNSRVTYQQKRSDKRACFGCANNYEDKMVVLRKTCTGTEPRTGFHELGLRLQPPCDGCLCEPLWCVSCAGRIFVMKQTSDNVHRDEYHLGSCPCPFCRKSFCIHDVHYVDFDFIAEEAN